MNNQANKMPRFQNYHRIDNSLDLITQSPGLHHILEKIFRNLDILSILECEKVNSVWKRLLNNPKIFLHKIYQNVSCIKTPEYFDYFEMYKRFEVKHIMLTKPEDYQHFGFSVIMWPSQFFAGRNEIYIHGVSRALKQLKKGTSFFTLPSISTNYLIVNDVTTYINSK